MNANRIGNVGLILIALVIIAANLGVVPFYFGYSLSGSGMPSVSAMLAYHGMVIVVLLLWLSRRAVCRVAFGDENEAELHLPAMNQVVRAALGVVGLWLLADVLMAVLDHFFEPHDMRPYRPDGNVLTVGEQVAAFVSVVLAVLLLVEGGRIANWWTSREEEEDA